MPAKGKCSLWLLGLMDSFQKRQPVAATRRKSFQRCVSAANSMRMHPICPSQVQHFTCPTNNYDQKRPSGEAHSGRIFSLPPVTCGNVTISRNNLRHVSRRQAAKQLSTQVAGQSTKRKTTKALSLDCWHYRRYFALHVALNIVRQMSCCMRQRSAPVGPCQALARTHCTLAAAWVCQCQCEHDMLCAALNPRPP